MSTKTDEPIDFAGGAPVGGSLEVVWNHGIRPGDSAAEPAIQVHHHDEHTVIMRQSKAVHYEAPFFFLLFGNERALLLDTGANEEPELFPLRTTVDGLIDRWLERHPREDYELVVAHTHGHGDHVAGDVQFAGRPHTTVVARELEAVQAFFGFDVANWPTRNATFDLGGRILELLGSPGHHAAAITCYDPWTEILFTGDTVLSGRLYAFDFPAFRGTLERMTDFAQTHPVSHVIGCHVEMHRRPGRDYPIGAEYQPFERAPQLTPAQLVAVRDAARSVAAEQGVHRFDDFVIYNEPSEQDMGRLVQIGMRAKSLAAAWAASDGS
jgi:glyoxylase-like metal-dependent hydrolase (beta-lactamase superfamily II)